MKKTMTVLLTLIFLLSLGILPAQAQAQTQLTSFAYIPLISPLGETALPVVFRARQAFEALAPQLLKAQEKGQIVRFEPDYGFGMLKVEYQSGFNLAAALAMTPGASPLVLETPQAVLEYTQVSQSLRKPLDGIADNNPIISISLYTSCFTAYYMGANNYFKAYLVDTGGRLVGSADGWANGSGHLNSCFGGIWDGQIPGDVFSLYVYNNAGTTLLNTFSTVIARLNFSSISVTNKTITGTAPANSQLNFTLDHAELDAGDNVTETGVAVTASSKGAWSVKLGSSVGMAGGDQVYISWSAPATNFTFYRYIWAPFANCLLGGNYCSIYGIPGKSAKLSIVHAKKTYKYSGKVSSSGYFGVDLTDVNADPIFLVVGDKVSGTGVKSWTLPRLTTIVNYTDDTVEGFAPASRYFWMELDVFDYSLRDWDYDEIWAGSNTAGYYVADFSGYFDIKTTDRLYTYLWYDDPSTGNETRYRFYLDP